jgi:RimJ/RimL family protein N-acetyltransferase
VITPTESAARWIYVRGVQLRPLDPPAPLPPEIVIRPIRSDDHVRLRDSHDRLSPESRYRRFLSSKPQLTAADTRYLVEVDGCDHYAIVATLPELPGEPIFAVARFIRFPDNREVAEMAIVVGDDHQRQGIGTEMVAQLGEAAVARGVLRFRATMLTENLGIRRLLEGLAVGPVDYRRLGGLAEMEITLPGADQAGADCGGHEAPLPIAV